MKKKINKDDSLAYLELFFPIHYRVGITIEDVLGSGKLTRQQTCILWMIHTRGEGGRVLKRKEIEQALLAWYEVTSSAVSKALRQLAKPPFNMLEIVEDPMSGREKLIHLTDSGQAFIENAIANGSELMGWMISKLSDEEVKQGIGFLSRVSEIFDELPDDMRALARKNAD